ncbi:MAG: DUF1730 domain-containing protein [Oscillospiraceae bacterium]|nr:DUF1730 domain-containing protein [Oscillospiraceae bacterium]MDD4414214.1 DUF1730 domain-containing protein [Oscillospiraceae bacterium]
MHCTDKRRRIDRILDMHGLSLHGYCRYDLISDRLLPCRALDRMNDAFPPDYPPKTVIVALFPYRTDERQGNLSRYARVPDYHVSAGKVLKQAADSLSAEFKENSFISFIDNSPIPEVRAAALAGLGCIGDHGLLINPDFGSWVFIGTVVTNLCVELPIQTINECNHCGICSASCPGGCIGSSSRESCASRISQLKGELKPVQTAIFHKSGMVWGCDRCQEACPLNAGAKIQPHPCFGKAFAPDLTRDTLNDLENKAYAWRGIDVLKRNLDLYDE